MICEAFQCLIELCYYILELLSLLTFWSYFIVLHGRNFFFFCCIGNFVALHDIYWRDHFVCMQLLAGVHYIQRKMCAELHQIVPFVQELDSNLAFFSFFFPTSVKAASMLCYFLLGLEDLWWGKKEVSFVP